eukprot:scaffold1463_cov101-Skeletonema_dohrnii-CCMP3373.AAC.3
MRWASLPEGRRILLQLWAGAIRILNVGNLQLSKFMRVMCATLQLELGAGAGAGAGADAEGY